MNQEEKDLLLLPFVGYSDGLIKYWELPASVNQWSQSTISYFARHCGKHMHNHKSSKLLVEIIGEMFAESKFGDIEKMFLERIGHYCYQGYWACEKESINPAPK